MKEVARLDAKLAPIKRDNDARLDQMDDRLDAMIAQCKARS